MYIIFILKITKDNGRWGWRYGAVIKSTYCFCKRIYVASTHMVVYSHL